MAPLGGQRRCAELRGRRGRLTRIVVSKPSEARRELALAMGADLAVHPTELDSSEVRGRVGEAGFHSVVDAVGRADIAKDLLGRLRKGGTLLVFGVADPEDGFTLMPREVFERELSIRG